MIHDPGLLDRLDALPKETFDGEVFRGTRQNLDPLASSYSGGRWMRRDAVGVLYTSLAREGALAEISFHWAQLNPHPTKPIMLHTLRVAAHRTLRLVRADFATLGVPESTYAGMNLPRTQEIGAAVEFLGCDGLIAPSARWSCDNLVLFPDRMSVDATLDIVTSEAVDWLTWAIAHGWSRSGLCHGRGTSACPVIPGTKMNHKRRKSKNQRAGCLMCKPNKMNGWPKQRELGHTGFGKLRDEAHARNDLKRND